MVEEQSFVDIFDYVLPGDTLDWRGLYSKVERVGPVLRIDIDVESGKRRILIESKKYPGVEIAVEIHRIIAVYRNDVEIVRF